ncbi:MAG: PspC domain-containing protein [Propionicimonas sp.]|uniref:PspC domain-containing protein n=1 Tax=Propionicimonas sp. TaxID=1955623 RepID=UPI003D11E69A
MKEKLTRSATDKFVGGVCGGVARSLGIDSGLVRIITVVLAFFWGLIVPVYLALWLVLPLEEGGSTGFDDLKKMFGGGNSSTPPSDYR